MTNAEDALRQANASLSAYNYELKNELEQAEAVLILADTYFKAGQAYTACWQGGEETGRHDLDQEAELQARLDLSTSLLHEALTDYLKRMAVRPPLSDTEGKGER